MKRSSIPLVCCALGLVLAATGCGLFSGGGTWDPFASQSERQLQIRVQNSTDYDVRIDVLAAGRRESLGLVGGRTDREFEVPWARTENIQFRLDPTSGSRLTVGNVLVSPGDRVDLYLQEPLSRSFVVR